MENEQICKYSFQSPQWGSNSKDNVIVVVGTDGVLFQSPQWGSNSKDLAGQLPIWSRMFQSPQWGSNSKG